MPMEPRLRRDLIELFERYADAMGVAPTTVASKVYGDARFYARLKGNPPSAFSVRAYDKIVAKFWRIWPKRVPWPEQIEKIPISQVVAIKRTRRAKAA